MGRGLRRRESVVADQALVFTANHYKVLTYDLDLFTTPIGNSREESSDRDWQNASQFIGWDALIAFKRYTGRTSKFENSVSIESSVCGCCGETLFDQRLIRLGLAKVTLVRPFPRPPLPAR